MKVERGMSVEAYIQVQREQEITLKIKATECQTIPVCLKKTSPLKTTQRITYEL